MPKSSKKSRGRMSRLQLESLENRILFSAVPPDTAGVVRPQADSPFQDWYFDLNNDPLVDVDRLYGFSSDLKSVTGDWNGDGSTDVGIVRYENGFMRWLLDTDGDPQPEHSFIYGLATDVPVVGDWDGNGTTNVGVARPEGIFYRWLYDTNMDPNVEEGNFIYGLNTDRIVTGDWNGDNKTDVGVARPEGAFYRWYFDLNRDPNAEEGNFIFGFSTDNVVTGDWDADGKTDVGVTRAEGPFWRWYLDTNRDPHPENDFLFGLNTDTPVTGHWILPEISVAVNNNTSVIASGTRLSFGTGEPGQPAPTQKITISNIGSGTLALSQPSVPLGFKVRNFPTTVASWTIHDFYIDIDPSVPGSQSGALVFGTNDGNENPFSIALREVTPEINVNEVRDEGTFDFGAVDLNALATQSFTIINEGNSSLIVQRPSISGPFSLKSGTFPMSITAGRSKSFEIAVNTLTRGAKAGSIRMATNDADENPYNFNLRAVVEETPQIAVGGAADGGSIDLGSADIGATLQKTFQISNPGTGTLVVERPTITGAFTLASGSFPMSIVRGESKQFTVRVNTSTSGGKSGHLSLDNNTGGTTDPYSFGLRASVAAPEIQIPEVADGGSFNFGTVEEDRNLTRRFTIQNRGSAPLVVQRPTIIGPFSVISGGLSGPTFPMTIQANREMTFTIRADTSTPGTKSGNISFVNNDGNQDENPYNFSLNANVTAKLVASRLFSLDRPQTLPGGVSISDADIVRIDIFSDDSYTFDVILDGSSVGLASLDAFTPLSNGNFYVSVRSGQSLPQIGNVFPADILHFNMSTQRWSRPSGLDDFSLNLTGANIDALTINPTDGRLLVSVDEDVTTLPAKTFGDIIQVDDADLISPIRTSFSTRFAWFVFSDTADLPGLDGTNPNEDIDAVSWRAGQPLERSTLGTASLGTLGVANNDMFTRQSNGWRTTFDASDYGITQNIDGFANIPAQPQSALNLPADFGDAPLSYPVALHTVGGPKLGTKRDVDSGQQSDANALGDDIDVIVHGDDDVSHDEDGITFGAGWLPGNDGELAVEVTEGTGYLNAWIDFDADGNWTPEEQVFTNQSLEPGTHSLTVPIPAESATGVTFARFRLSSFGDNDVGGLAVDGEVEDYQLNIHSPTKVESVKVGSPSWSTEFVNAVDPDGIGYALRADDGRRTVPWTNVRQIFVEFSSDVGSVDRSHIRLVGANQADYAPLIESVTYSSIGKRATITLSEELAADKLLLLVDDAVTDLNGNALDGNTFETQSLTQTGDGIPGGDFIFRFEVLPGDTNGSGSVAISDLGPIRMSLGRSVDDEPYSIFADANGSGRVSVNDVSALRQNLGRGLPLNGPISPVAALVDVALATQTSEESGELDSSVPLDDLLIDSLFENLGRVDRRFEAFVRTENGVGS